MNLSVIVTTYNNPEYLIKVLCGLRLQIKPPEEVIIADDGSGPETAKVVADFSKTSNFPVRHVRHEDEGFRAAKIRNEAIKVSSGDYIVLLDGDCIPHEMFVHDHIRLSERGFFVQGKRVLINEKASVLVKPEQINSISCLAGIFLSGGLSNTHHIIRMPLFPSFKNNKLKGIKSCNMGFFREDLFAVNGFNESFIGWGREDSELSVRLFNYGLKRKEHPFMAICFHLWHKEEARHGLSQNDELLESAMKSKEFFCENGIIKYKEGHP